MPIFDSPWKHSQPENAFSYALPIIMEKRRMQREDAIRKQEIMLAAQEAERQRKEKQQELINKAYQARVKYMQDMMKTAYEKGDTEGVQAYGQPLSNLGYTVPAEEQAGPSQPGQGPPLRFFAAPKNLTGDAGNLQAILGRKPTLQELVDYRKSGATNVKATASTGGASPADAIVKKANEAYGGKVGDRVNTRFQQAEEANRQNAQLDQVSLALAQGAQTGYGEEFLLNMKSLGQTLGLDVGDLSGQEMIRRISNEMALRLRNPESGLGLTGNTSNKDLQFLKDSVMGLSRTEQGNRAIINAMRQFNRMRKDVAIKQSEIIDANDGSIPADIDKQLMEYVNEYDLFTPGERRQIESYLKEGKTTPQDADAAAEELIKKYGNPQR